MQSNNFTVSSDNIAVIYEIVCILTDDVINYI